MTQNYKNRLQLSRGRQQVSKMLVEFALQAQNLTRRDLKDWRNAWQMALSVDNPSRIRLYDIYTDVEADLHLSGCVDQRKRMVLKKSFKLTNLKGEEDKEATELLEAGWFKNLMSYCLDSRYWGHSLIELGNAREVDGRLIFPDLRLIPRRHVIPEYGRFTIEQGQDWRKGISYRDPQMARYLIEAGGSHDLGLYLKCAAQTIPKKYMLGYWDQFGELFGMPIRIGKTTSRDPKERTAIEGMLDNMGAASWALFPEGTEIEIKESAKGDAFNVYDRRIDRANSELSKGVLNQTMTIDSGSSLSQSEVHLEVFQNVVDSDADFLRDIVNYQLLPKMAMQGFPVQGLRFNWDENVDYTPEQQVSIEQMIMGQYEVDPQYFIDKYNIPITGKKEIQPTLGLSRGGDFFD